MFVQERPFSLYSDYNCSLSVVEKEIISKIYIYFFTQALESWLQFQFNPPEKTEQIIQQILWLNSNILLIDLKKHFSNNKKNIYNLSE